MPARRVVTGQTATGKAIIVSDGPVEPVTLALLPGTEFYTLWASDAPVQLPSAGDPSTMQSYFPPVGGFRFGLNTLPPDSVTRPADLDLGAALAELNAKLSGVAEVTEPANPGMHRSDTIDFVVVLAGEVWLELDDGVQVLVRQGDCVVQNGTRHAWRNRSSAPCVVVFAMIGAARPA